MKKEFVYLDFVDVYDDEIFTKEKAYEWQKYIVDSYKSVYENIKKRLDYSTPVQIYVDKSLLEETIIDAIIGMKKIVDSHNNSVESPNPFKIAAYLSYWWLRHKPVSIHYPVDYDIRTISLVPRSNESNEQYTERCRKMVWDLKHINELVAVQMVMHYIFDPKKVICNQKRCNYVKKANKGNYCFDSFNDMYLAIQRKLTYYFAYRALAPKMIEHILEAYTFHPAWGLTGPHWSGDLQENGDSK